jgi:hypothetical protein
MLEHFRARWHFNVAEASTKPRKKKCLRPRSRLPGWMKMMDLEVDLLGTSRLRKLRRSNRGCFSPEWSRAGTVRQISRILQAAR